MVSAAGIVTVCVHDTVNLENFRCKNIFVVDGGYENWHALLTLMR